jgi:hypothetical protein
MSQVSTKLRTMINAMKVHWEHVTDPGPGDHLISPATSLSWGDLLLGRIWKFWDWQAVLGFLSLPLLRALFASSPLSYTQGTPLDAQMVRGPLEWVGTCLAHRLQSSLGPQRREACKVKAALRLTTDTGPQSTYSTSLCTRNYWRLQFDSLPNPPPRHTHIPTFRGLRKKFL